MGDTASGSWGSRELGGHIRQEEARVEREEWKIEWYVCKEGDRELWRVPRSIGPISIDHNHWAGWHLTADEQQAKLISAAPEMLGALRRVDVHLLQSRVIDSELQELLDVIEGAIRKATEGG